MKNSFKIALLFTLIINKYIVGQEQELSKKRLDDIVLKFAQGLRQEGIDTICYFRTYCQEGYSSVDDSCDYFDPLLSHSVFIFWKRQNRTFLTKRTNCYDFSITEIKQAYFWDIYYKNEKTIRDEVIKKFQILESDNGKKVPHFITTDHSCFREFTFEKSDSLSTSKEFDIFNLQKKSSVGNNINYKHNKSLKSKMLIDELSKNVEEVNRKKALTRIRR